MKNKYFLFVLVLSFAILAATCIVSAGESPVTNQESEAYIVSGQYEQNTPQNFTDNLIMVSYQINTGNYTENNAKKNIDISYPQIIISGDSDRQSSINDLLKREALYFVNMFSEDDTRHLSMRIKYKITCLSKDLLSVQYLGSAYIQGAPYPSNLFYTTNIDISAGNKLRLQDVVNIDENFVAKFRDEGLKPLRLGEIINGEKVFVKRFGTDPRTPLDTINLFNDADLARGIYCYFTSDSLGISVPVAHAIGDHAEFEIKYREITSNIKDEKIAWINALQKE